MDRWRSEEGAVTALVAVLAIGLIAMAGLAYDGGAIITATADARDVASAAARAGAQQVDLRAVHAGAPVLETSAAVTAVEAFLTSAGYVGTATVTGASVTVTVTRDHPMRLLPLTPRRIVATSTATAVSDVLEGSS